MSAFLSALLFIDLAWPALLIILWYNPKWMIFIVRILCARVAGMTKYREAWNKVLDDANEYELDVKGKDGITVRSTK